MTATPACAAEPELFFVSGDGADAHMLQAEALRICAECPLLAACQREVLDAAYDKYGDHYGIRAGMTVQQRASFRRNAARKATRKLRAAS